MQTDKHLSKEGTKEADRQTHKRQTDPRLRNTVWSA
jgi:hypothetical protein